MPIGVLPVSGGGGGGGSPSIDVLQANNYVDGQAVYFNGASWDLAQANAAATLGLGILTDVVQSPDPAAGFTVVFSGPFAAPLAYPLETGGVSTPGPLSPGQYYFVSSTVAGALTLTEPSVPNQFSNPILFALSTTEAVALPFRPSAVAGPLFPGPASDLLDAAGNPVTVGSGLSYSGGPAGTLTTSDIVFASGDTATWQATGTATEGQTVTYQTQTSTIGAVTAIVDTFTPTTNTGVDVIVTVTAAALPIAPAVVSSEFFKQDVEAFFTVVGAVVTEIDSNTKTAAKKTANLGNCAVDIITNGTTISVRVTGQAGQTLRWTANVTRVARQA